ncbi:MAG: universal stress protein [Bacteriovoracaceae bacterium]
MRKIAICLSLDKSLSEDHKFLKTHPELLAHKDITVVHAFEKTFYNDDFSKFSWPEDNKWDEIEPQVLSYLKTIGEKILPDQKPFKTDTFLSESSKAEFCEYLEKNKFDMVFVYTRAKHGIEGMFSSSFAEYLVKFAPCAVVTLRAN